MITPGKSVLVSEIWVDREARQRRELTNIEPLMESIQKRGLINPITITHDNQLIAGERRFTAVSRLGWTHVDVRYVEDLDPAELQMLELEENIRRENITWQEEALAYETYHKLKLSLNPEWSQSKTAEDLGVSPQKLGDKLALAQELNNGNTKIAALPAASTALNIVRRAKERERTSTLKQVAAIVAPDTAEPALPIAPLYNLDFCEWAETYSGVKFNFIHCDFPYGINASNQKQGNNTALYGEYSDGFNVFEKLLDSFEANQENFVAENSHMIFWFSIEFYQYVFNRLTKMGWKVNPFPLIWFKTDNTGLLPDPNRGPRRVYETAFFCTRNERFIISAVGNAVGWPGRDKEIHMSEKPVGMLKHFFRMVCDTNTVFLDPTCGSGNSVKTALELKANHAIGLEINPEFHARAVEHFFDEPEL